MVNKIKDINIMIYFQSDEGDIEFDGIKSIKELNKAVSDIKRFIKVDQMIKMVRKKEEYGTISVPMWLKAELEKDRTEFERTIGGGKWSIADTISEYRKIINANLVCKGLKK